jgi:antitoxin ParD1/3/4
LTKLQKRDYVVGMASLNVSLPKTLRKYIESQVKSSGYSTPSEYVRTLIREDQKRKGWERIEALLLEGVSSGAPVEVNRRYWDKKRVALTAGRRKIRR